MWHFMSIIAHRLCNTFMKSFHLSYIHAHSFPLLLGLQFCPDMGSSTFSSAYNILHRILSLRQVIPNVTRAATNFYHFRYLRTSYKYHYYSREKIWSRKT